MYVPERQRTDAQTHWTIRATPGACFPFTRPINLKKAAWFSEIEPFPSAVLAHHYPYVPNLGDIRKIHDKETFKKETIDILVGGTPRQSFSVNGFRAGSNLI